MAVPYCIHCGAQFPSGGYCDESPDGEHEVAINEDAVNPYDCCPDCGVEMNRAEIDGFAEHVCDPDLIAARNKEVEEYERQQAAELDLHVAVNSRRAKAQADINAQLVAMLNLGAVKGKSPIPSKQTTYLSPTKKVKEESKTRRKMAKASRKKNRK